MNTYDVKVKYTGPVEGERVIRVTADTVEQAQDSEALRRGVIISSTIDNEDVLQGDLNVEIVSAEIVEEEESSEEACDATEV